MDYFSATIPAGTFQDVAVTPGDNIRISHDHHAHVDAMYESNTVRVPLYDGIGQGTVPVESSPENLRITAYSLPVFVAVTGP